MRAVVFPAAAAAYPHEAGLGVPGPVREPEPVPRVCTELTKAGEPCKGTPGDDGLCAAHKPRGDASGPAVVGADPPAEKADDGEEDSGPQDGEEEDRVAEDGA